MPTLNVDQLMHDLLSARLKRLTEGEDAIAELEATRLRAQAKALNLQKLVQSIVTKAQGVEPSAAVTDAASPELLAGLVALGSKAGETGSSGAP